VVVGSGDRAYACHTAHTSASATEPGEGADWEDVWIQIAADGAEGPAGPAGPPAADWVWLEGQPTETAGNPGLLVLGSVPFPDWQPGLSVEWQAHVTVVDNPNSTNLTALTVRVSDDATGDVDVSQGGIAQDAPGGFQDAFALAGSFTVGTHSIFGTIAVGNATRTKNTTGSNVATVFGIPSEPIGANEVLRLVATKPINSAGLALKVMSFGYRVIRPAD
jgi:hypothetical protein